MWAALQCWIAWLAGTIRYHIVEGSEMMIDAVAFAANAVLALLPQLDLGAANPDGGVLAALNYVVPIGPLTVMFSSIMTAWILYRVYQWLLKVAQVAD